MDLQHLVRRILRDGQVLDTLKEPHFLAAEENCLKLIDSLDTSQIAAGAYDYAVTDESAGEDADPGLRTSLRIVIREPEPAAAGAGSPGPAPR